MEFSIMAKTMRESADRFAWIDSHWTDTSDTEFQEAVALHKNKVNALVDLFDQLRVTVHEVPPETKEGDQN
jgi:uncharacterized protein YukE